MSTRIAKSKPLMRKEPRQARSVATVEAILLAGARILSDRGWAGFTTNGVAEAAGVSIGSLYQYFPDKLSLIEAIRCRHLDDCLAVIRNSGKERKPLARFVEDLVRDMIAAHGIHPGLHRVLLDEAPGFDRDPHSAFEAEYLGHYITAVAAYRGHEADATDETIALVISDAIDGVIHNAARRGTLNSAEVGRELVRMVGLYLADGSERQTRSEDWAMGGGSGFRLSTHSGRCKFSFSLLKAALYRPIDCMQDRAGSRLTAYGSVL